MDTAPHVEVPGQATLQRADGSRLQRLDQSRVVVEIVPVDTGCELTLAHESVLPDQASRIEGRWAGMLYGLGTMLGRNSRRARPGNGQD